MECFPNRVGDPGHARWRGKISRSRRHRLDPMRDHPIGEKGMSETQATKRSEWSWWYLLFAVQFVALLWPPFYNRIEPTWIGMPFFYWYQMLWVIIAGVLNAIVYFMTKR
jgi:hypothetical protein